MQEKKHNEKMLSIKVCTAVLGPAPLHEGETRSMIGKRELLSRELE